MMDERIHDPGMPINEETAVSPVMSNVMENSTIMTLDQEYCIPLHLSRPNVEGTILKLEFILHGRMSKVTEVLCGVVSETPISVLVPLFNDLECLIVDLFLTEKYSVEKANEAKERRNRCHCIIDGCKFYWSIIKLRTTDPPKWLEYRWAVIGVQPYKTTVEYR